MGKICASALPNHLNIVRMFLNIYIFYIQLIQPVALKNPSLNPIPAFLTLPNFPPKHVPRTFTVLPRVVSQPKIKLTAILKVSKVFSKYI